MGRGRSASFSDDDSDSDCYGIRSGGVSKQQRRRTKERKPKDQSVPWTEEEMERLLHLVQERMDPSTGGRDDLVNWGEVAQLLGGRTAKQCREKFRNDLRPDITKAPWTLEEEYILAVAHSQLGNKWNDIAKFLPRRAENTIKNHWYASMRAKADCKTRTFLWVYGSMAGRNPDPSVLEMAKERYAELAAVSGGALAPLATFMVPENYFTTGEGAQQYAILQQAELAAATLGPGNAPVRSASARAAMSQGTSYAGAPAASHANGARRTRVTQESAGTYDLNTAVRSAGAVLQSAMSMGNYAGVSEPGMPLSGTATANIPLPTSEQREAQRLAVVAAASQASAGAARETRGARRSGTTSPSREASAAYQLAGQPPPHKQRTSFDGDASCMLKLPSYSMGCLPGSGMEGGQSCYDAAAMGMKGCTVSAGLPPKAGRKSRDTAAYVGSQHEHSLVGGAGALQSQASMTLHSNSHVSNHYSCVHNAQVYPGHHPSMAPQAAAAHMAHIHGFPPAAQMYHMVPVVYTGPVQGQMELNDAIWAETLAGSHLDPHITADDQPLDAELLAEFGLAEDWPGQAIKQEPCYGAGSAAGYNAWQPKMQYNTHPKHAPTAPAPAMVASGAPQVWSIKAEEEAALSPPASPHPNIPGVGHAPLAGDTPVSTARTGMRPPGAVSRFATAAAQPLPFPTPSGAYMGEADASDERVPSPAAELPVSPAHNPQHSHSHTAATAAAPFAHSQQEFQASRPATAAMMYHLQQVQAQAAGAAYDMHNYAALGPKHHAMAACYPQEYQHQPAGLVLGTTDHYLQLMNPYTMAADDYF